MRAIERALLKEVPENRAMDMTVEKNSKVVTLEQMPTFSLKRQARSKHMSTPQSLR
jgi:hypothetical protein